MSDKISTLLIRQKNLIAQIENLSKSNTPEAAALVRKLKRRHTVLDKKIANLWE